MTRTNLSLRVAAVLLVLLAWSGRARAHDPRLKWRTITTRHFYIHYYKRIRPVAWRVAVLAEAAHGVLSKVLRHTPRRRTHVVLWDDTDGANGIASVLPRNVITLYATAPGDLETLGDYDDWLFLLILHEYTHILHLTTTNKLIEWINRIFGFGRGAVYFPNLVQPNWFIEGIAVLNETARTSGGRLRSSLYRMMMRTAVLEDKAFNLGELSSAPSRYPHGRAPYLYGAYFIQYLARRYGEPAVVRVGRDYGKQTLPFGINKVARWHLGGKHYVTLYREWMRSMRKRFGLTRRRVQRRGVREGRRLTFTGESTMYPRFHPNGRDILFAESDGRWEQQLKMMPAAGGKVRRLTRVESIGAASFTPDGQKVVFHQAEVHRTYYYYSDLFVWDLKRRTYKRLTRGLRAREPAVSPDGRTVAFTVNRAGRTCLALMAVGGGQHRKIHCGRRFEQVYTPAWNPDGRTLAYSAWTWGGYRDLYLLDTVTGKQRRLTADRAMDTGPVFSPDGLWLYFSSDRTGIYNIYAMRISDGATWQVTNLLGGAFQPTVSPDGRSMVYVGFHAEGYDLYRLELKRERFLPALPPLRLRPHARKPSLGAGTDPASKRGSAGKANGPPKRPKVILSDKPYNPLRTLWPEGWWFTYQGAVGSGLQSLTLTLNGSDVVGHHAWSAATTYAFDAEVWSVGLGYSYSRLWPSFHVGFYYNQSPRSNWRIDGLPEEYLGRNVSVNAGVDLPVLRSLRYGTGSFRLRYRWEKAGCWDCLEPEPDPGNLVPQKPDFSSLAGLSVMWDYSMTRAFTYSVSPEMGRSLGVTFNAYIPELGGDHSAGSLSWRWTEYLPIPRINHHVVTLRLSGGVGWGEAGYRSLFSVGGFGEQDWVRALIDQAVVVGASLRGYDPAVAIGDQYHLLNVEYRFPICWINWAPWTLPIYFRRLWGTAFMDWGHAFFGDLTKDKMRDSRVGAGGELLLQMVAGYGLWWTLRLGYAYGFMEGGGHRYYFMFGVPLS